MLTDLPPTDLAAQVAVNDNAVASTKRKKHAPMTPQQQTDRMNEIKLQIDVMGGPTEPPGAKKKKRKTLTPETSPVKADFEEMETKMPSPPDEKATTPPEDKPGDQEAPKRRKSKEYTDKVDIPAEIVKMMKTLNSVGAPFEKALADVFSVARVELGRTGGNEEVAAELQAKGRKWLTDNRTSLKEVEALLSRYGVVPIGGVEIPDESL